MSRLFIVAAVLACIPTHYLSAQVAADGTATAAAAIEREMEHWLVAYEAQDAEALAELFMENGIYAANTGQVFRGREDIRQGVAAWFAATPAAKVDVRRVQLRFRQAGRNAHDLSRFTIHVVGPECIVDAGHTLSVWRREADGQWRLETLLVNRDPEPPAGACNRPPERGSTPGSP